MPHIILDNLRDLHFHNLIALFHLHCITDFESQNVCRLLTDGSPLRREIIMFSTDAITQIKEISKTSQIFRYFHHRIHTALRRLQFHTLAIHLQNLLYSRIRLHLVLYLCLFLFRGIPIKNSACLIGKQVDKLILCNRCNGILQAKSHHD